MPSAADIRAGGAFVELYTKNGPLYAGLKNAQRRVAGWSSNVLGAGRKLLGLGAMITGPLVGAAKVFASTGDNLDKMSGRTGVSVEALSELGFAAEQGGADLATVESGVRRMQRSLADAGRGLSTPTEGLEMIGLSVQQLQGLNPEQQFQRIADGITAINDPTQKAAAAMMLFGRSGAQLLPMLDGLADTRQQARDLGLVVSTEDAQKAAKFTDQLNIMGRVLKQGVFSAGAAVAPELGKVVMAMINWIKAGSEWINQNRQLFTSLLKIGGIITAAGAALTALGGIGMGFAGILGGLAAAVPVVGGVLSMLGTVFGALLSPIGLVVAAIAGVTAYVLKASGGFESLMQAGDVFGKLFSIATDAFGGIKDALAAGDYVAAARLLWAAIGQMWQAGAADIGSILSEALSKTFAWLQSGLSAALGGLWEYIAAGFGGAAGQIAGVFGWAQESVADGLASLGQKFGELFSIATDAFGGIKDALAAGDFKMAAEVLWASLRLAWITGTEELRRIWTNVRYHLELVWSEFAFGVMDILNELWSGMESGFWKVADSIVDAWRWAEKTLAKGVAWIIGTVSEDVTPEQVMQTLEEDYARKQRGVDAERTKRDEEVQSEADGRRAAIATARQDAQDSAAKKRDARLAGAAADLADAQKKFAAVREAAKVAREEREKMEQPPAEDSPATPPPSPTPEMAAPAAKLAGSAAVGSLDAYKTLAGLRDPNTQIRRKQLDALEQIVSNTKAAGIIKEAVPPKR